MDALKLAFAIVSGLFEAIKAAIEDSGKDVAELREADITVSMSFGGEEGEAIVVQRKIEELIS